MTRRETLHGVGAASFSAIAGGLLTGLAGQGVNRAHAAIGAVTPFDQNSVMQLARDLSATPYRPAAITLPPRLKQLSYDDYRAIRFRTEQAIWRGKGHKFELQLFPMGWLYNKPVRLWLVDGDQAKELLPDGQLFDFGKLKDNPPNADEFGFAGFRVHGPINRADYFDEYLVFQGASYFRAVARGQTYGLSARGLALDTAEPGGEEFPVFRTFWIEQPAKGDDAIRVHALLDSPSTTGAYRFDITPGDVTRCDVRATLFPRKDLKAPGLAPLTSMFLLGPNDRQGLHDFRPSVHDSEGLAILNGKGERLWRPLNNPKTLQVSAFVDDNPRGFGLIQRDRAFTSYEDLEANYEKRPSLWVEPTGPWGRGAVHLVEIPTREEIHDNIVAFWRPEAPLKAGAPYTMSYRLHWGADVPTSAEPSQQGLARVVKTRVGDAWKARGTLFVIDYVGGPVQPSAQKPEAQVTTSAGAIENVVVQPNRATGGTRVSFEVHPPGVAMAELRADLRVGGKPVAETWLYRWSRP
ncbi:MAG: glucan biosynthesis protein [Pseudomonadota bacterium]